MKHILLLLCFFSVATAATISRKYLLSEKFSLEKFHYAKQLVLKPENLEMSCLACTLMVDGVQALIRQNSTDEEIANFVIEACDFLRIEEPLICRNIVPAFMVSCAAEHRCVLDMGFDEVLFVLARTLFTPDEICGAVIPDCGQSVNPFDDMWPLNIPGNKPPVKPWPKIPDGKPTYRVLHLSDIHIDRQYTVGTEAYCQLDSALTFPPFSLCCRNYTDDWDKPIYVPAGKYGSPYVCDLPYPTFEYILNHISQTHKDLDYIMITGDFEAHDPWDYTEDLTRANVQNITAALLKFFPTTPIYVSIGNHEGVPQDAMAPHTMPDYDERGPQWIYSIMKDMWANWIPNSQLPTVQYRASYATYVKPGLKLISLNTVYCSSFNFYLYIDQQDPDATLEWLIDQLSDSEAKGEKVHIMSHIPPGVDYCLKGWSWNFYEIVKRYQNTIAQQFYGHTHNDHFQVYYDSANPNTRPFHFNWITPSLTTNAHHNPAYRIYTIDGGYEGASYTVKEAETYTTDLEEANQKNKDPVFSLEYKFAEYYNLTDLSPQSFSDLSDRLWTDKNLFRQYVKFFWRNNYDNECYTDYQCHRNYVCEMKKGRSHDDSFCAQLQ